MPIRFQVASDVVRDGLGVELLDENNSVLAEVFRNDAKHELTLTCYSNDIPLVYVERLMEVAREELGMFEDGKPLPPRVATN